METRSISDKARIIVTKDMMDVSIVTLLSQLYMANHRSYTHSINVAYLTAQITLQEKYEKEVAKDIIIGALLHDIGMMTIPEIVGKHARLTLDEYEQVKRHPYVGAQILKETAPHLAKPIILDILLSHHERTDGSGYPFGITDVPEFAQIIHAVDIYDAITSDKVNKKGKSAKQGLQTLANEGVNPRIISMIDWCLTK